MEAQTKGCRNCKKDFTIEPDDFGFYEKIKVPPPTFCPDCRFQRRLLFRNERNFYKRKCDLCQKEIIASYPADAPFPVYCVRCWWSDKWDPKSYGTDFNPSRPFFEQYKELQNKVPVLSIQNDDGIGSLNSEWSYDWAFSKNCYLGVCGWHVENGAYMYNANYDKEVVDICNVSNSELVYEGVNCDRCYNVKYCTLCFDSNDCVLGFDLRGCSNCTMCVGLRSAQYCILNQRYSKEEYEQKIKELNLGSRKSLQARMKEFQDLVLKIPKKFAYNIKTVNSTGNNLIEVKMSKDCFYVIGPTENSRFLVINDRAKDCYDLNNTGNPELCYESVTPDNSRGNKFTIFCWKCVEAEYSNNCHSCVNAFGCIGLKHTSYAIFNKQYSKEEYISLREKIIEHMKTTGEWGEFFPSDLSPFAYNETAALEWFPLAKEEASAQKYKWKENEKRNYLPTKTPIEVPDTIQEVADTFLGEIIECAHKGKCGERCTEAFRIIPREASFYRRMDIPLPVICPNCRHFQRFKLKNPPHLYHRPCMCDKQNHFHGERKCAVEFETSYAPERPEIVYCEKCYQAEVY
jgi:hypothetical protein